MNRFIFTIVKDQLIFNKEQRISLSKTNIPQKYGTFKGYFYWEAEIITYDEYKKVLHAKIIDYEALKDDFDTTKALPFMVDRIQFESIDLKSLCSCLYDLAENIELDDPDLKFPKEHHSHGALLEQFDVHLSSGHFAIGNGYLTSTYRHKGREILLKFSYPSVTFNTVLGRNLFKKVLNKHEALVNVAIYEEGVDCKSEELNKVIAACPKVKETHSSVRADNTSNHQSMAFPYNTKLTAPSTTTRKPSPPTRDAFSSTSYKCKESISVKFSDLTYEEGKVSFSMTCAASKKTLRGVVNNPTIKQEFRYITKYFCNVFGKEKATFDLTLKKKINTFGQHYETEILSVSSKEIDQINSDLIVEIQKDCCFDQLFAHQDKPKLENISDLLKDLVIDPEIQSAKSLVELIAERKPDSKHILQLRYLASQHIAGKMPLARGDDPRALLFLVRGVSKSYLVLETINSKLATYIWECSDSKEGLQTRIKEVKDFIATTDSQKRRKYRSTKLVGFYFIEHKYQNIGEDFIAWQKEFTEIIS